MTAPDPEAGGLHGGGGNAAGPASFVPEQAPRGAWAWWWAYAVSTVVLVAVLVTAVVAGRGFDVAIPALAVCVLGFVTAVLDHRARRRTPVPSPPRAVARATGRADARELRAVLREARRGRTVDGPLAAASVWHRDHRFSSSDAPRLPYGLGLQVGLAGNLVAQYVAGGFAQTGLLVIFWLGTVLIMGYVVTSLWRSWVLLTHPVPPRVDEAGP